MYCNAQIGKTSTVLEICPAHETRCNVSTFDSVTTAFVNVLHLQTILPENDIRVNMVGY